MTQEGAKAQVCSLETFPLHLGLGATAIVQSAFTGMDWYADYGARHGADGAEGRLVSMHSFSESWASWEMHPAGEEVVVCTAGSITLVQQLEKGREQRLVLGPGDCAINPRGVWHTADISEPATVLFITAGMGTQAKPR